MDYPKILSSKDFISQDNKFIFISYCHGDREKVYKSLFEFYDKGINFWYDNELNAGEAWNEEVEKVLCSDNCVGALFFLSHLSVMSEAVETEIGIVKKLCKDAPAFFVASVSLEGYSINHCVRQAYISLTAHDDASLNKYLPTKRVMTVLDMFKDNIIYFNYNDSEMLNNLIQLIRAKKLDVINNQEDIINKLFHANKVTNAFNERVFQIGKYLQEYDSKIELYVNGEVVIDNRTYCRVNDRAYELKNLHWSIISSENNIVTIIATKAIDIGSVMTFEAWKNKFLVKSFSASERDSIIECRLPSKEEIVLNKQRIGSFDYTDYCAYKKVSRFDAYATSTTVNKLSNVAINQNAGVITAGINNTTMIAIRPVLTIDINKL